jgi:sugar lactone lactonase YvrE
VNLSQTACHSAIRSASFLIAKALNGVSRTGTGAMLFLLLTLGAISLNVDAQTAHFSYAQLTLGGGFSSPSGVAVDGSGNVNVADYNNNAVKEIVTPAVNFSTVPVGTTSAATTLTFTFDSAGSLSSTTPYLVLTEGAKNLDFNAAATQESNVCNGTTAYTTGETCTINVTFTPIFPGTRYGAVVLESSGGVVATAYLQGTGTGPQVNFMPGTQSVVANAAKNGLFDPEGVAVDGSGNVYIADAVNNRVLKETLSAGSYTQSVVANSANNGITYPNWIAVDGSGNVYITDTVNNRVFKETLAAGSYTQSVVANAASNGLRYPRGVTVDGSGNVYIADTGNARVLKETLTASGYTQSVVASYANNGLSAPVVLAVDGSGNVYVTCLSPSPNSQIFLLKETLSAGSYTQSVVASYETQAIDDVYWVAVDGVGNVFIDVYDNNAVLKLTFSAGGYTQSVIADLATNGLNEPEGIAVDGNGNVYIADNYTNQVSKEDFADPPSLTFANTAVGSTSSDSPKAITVENVGNLPLDAVASGLAFSVPSFVQVEGPGTPADCTSGFALAPGADCNISISFTPKAAGSISGSLVLTDNALNGAVATQTIPLTGVGIGTSTVSLTSLLAFPNTAVQVTSAPLAATLTNTGTTSLTGIAPTITGANPSDFAISTGANACGATLAAGSSCSIYVTFTPASAASFSATLSVADSATGSPQTSSLTGTGTAPVAALSAPVAFPNTPTGTTAIALAATLSNTGNAALNNIVPTITGANPSDFAISTGAGACGASLAAGSSCKIYVTFTPASATSFSATLSVADSATGSPQTSSLTGTGTTAVSGVWPNGYQYQATFTVAAGKVPSSQTNFPVLISGTFADFATTGNGGKVANTCNQTVGNNVTSVPCDLIFTSDAAGTQLLSWEYETYAATSGAVNVWVNVPNLANGTVIYAWYGQPAVTTSQSTPSATWSNYMAVYHMKENPAGGAPQLNDSTGNGNNATMQGAAVAGQQQPGVIDGSIGFTFSTWAKLSSTSAFSFERTDSFSLSGWIKIASNTTGEILTKQSGAMSSGWMLFQNPVGASPAIEFGLIGTGATNLALARTPSISMGTWHYVVATYSGTSTTAGMSIYVDGVPQTLTTIANNLSTTIVNNLAPAINSRATPFLESNDGMDELRVSTKGVVLTPAWVTASYNNESNPGTFFTVTTGLTNP